MDWLCKIFVVWFRRMELTRLASTLPPFETLSNGIWCPFEWHHHHCSVEWRGVTRCKGYGEGISCPHPAWDIIDYIAHFIHFRHFRPALAPTSRAKCSAQFKDSWFSCPRASWAKGHTPRTCPTCKGFAESFQSLLAELIKFSRELWILNFYFFHLLTYCAL